MGLHDLAPIWPDTAHSWAQLALITGMAVFKLDRGTLMKRRAAYVDRFGASIIAFDLVFGVTLLITAARLLVPRLQGSGVLFWATLVPLFLVMGWQWLEVRHAARERLHVAMAGAVATSPWQPGDPDRRTGPADRRRAQS